MKSGSGLTGVESPSHSRVRLLAELLDAMTQRRRWVWGVILVAVVSATGVLPMAGRSVGHWLIVEDPPHNVRAIVVLGGGLPFRAIEAAAIYKQGWADEVWLTQGRLAIEQLTLEQLGVAVTGEDEYSRRVLLRRGVPDSAIRVLPERNDNTADEIRTTARHLAASGGGQVIFVTSKFHTRRVRYLWRLLAADSAAALVRYTPDDPFDADGWWLTTRDAMAVAREYFGMLNAWAGFPLRSR